MTAAQTAAKAKFKKAIAYRQKTGVSLKEAFAHVYGKKVGAAPKKKAAKKKATPKKAAKKVVKKAAKKKIGYSKTRLKQEKGITKVLKSTPRTLFPYTEEEKVVKAGKKYFDQKAKELHEKGVSGVKKKKAAPKKRKPIKEQSILNKIHKVKDQVNQLDELQHKHMIGKRIKIGSLPTYKDKDAAREIQLFADNDSQLYYQRRNPILKNLSKKYLKGQYDIEKAAKLWRYYIDAALQKYHKEFGGRGSWSNLLSVPDRNLLSLEYAKRTKEEFDLGNTY
jgi:hypothetical protein